MEYIQLDVSKQQSEIMDNNIIIKEFDVLYLINYSQVYENKDNNKVIFFELLNFQNDEFGNQYLITYTTMDNETKNVSSQLMGGIVGVESVAKSLYLLLFKSKVLKDIGLMDNYKEIILKLKNGDFKKELDLMEPMHIKHDIIVAPETLHTLYKYSISNMCALERKVNDELNSLFFQL